MKRGWVLAVVLLIVPWVAQAREDGAHVRMGMVVAGTVTVNPDGSVRDYTLHEPDKLPKGVVEVIGKTVPRWEFQPVSVDGHAVTATAGMSLRIVADPVDNAHVAVKVAGANFGCNAFAAKGLLPNVCESGTSVVPVQRKPPKYPPKAIIARAGGEVFLMVDVGRDGRVLQVAARQVNLYSLEDGRAANMRRFRRVLARAAIDAARHWRFRAPTVGAEARLDHWIVQVPVDFTISGTRPDAPAYGAWSSYVPGPVERIPWAHDDASGGGASAIAGDAPFVPDARFVLKTSLASAGDSS